MNYRHYFHAGNFADLLKHAVLLDLIERATRAGAPPLDLLETHAGAGAYPLPGDATIRGSEAQAGIGRLLTVQAEPPLPLARLAARVRSFAGEQAAAYPGSPLLALGALRPGDRYVGCELRPDDHATLAAAMGRASARAGVDVQTFKADGYAQVAATPARRQRIVLIDPPYERGDERERIVELVARLARSTPDAVVAVWAPLKDLETLDRLRAGIEAVARAPGWIVEARLRALRDPLTMNGCALIVLGAVEAAPSALAVAGWIADHLGEPSASSRLQTLDVASRNLRGDEGVVSPGRERKADVRKAQKPSAGTRRD